jgi:hypothetical protein
VALRAAKYVILSAISVNRSSDAALAKELMRHLHVGRDFTWDAKFEKAITRSSAQSNATLHRPFHFVTIKAGDFHLPQLSDK